MKKTLIIIIICTFNSCGNNTKNFKLETFNDIKIKVPSNLITESASVCENEISLKDAHDSIFINIKLCDYNRVKQVTFEGLKRFFQEQCETLKEEVPESILITNKSKDYGNYYKFAHEFKIGEIYYGNNYIAYEKYFLTIRYETKSEKNLPELRQTVEMLAEKNLSKKIVLTENKKDCYYCNLPLFW